MSYIRSRQLARKGSSDISTEIIPDFLKICDWLQANKLSLNILKTEYMIIGTEKSLIQLGPNFLNSIFLRRVGDVAID